MQNVRNAVAHYSRIFNTLHATNHTVTSPLSAWLLIALCAKAASETELKELSSILGMDANQAFEAAHALLSNPHPAVGAALGFWTRQETQTTALRKFQAELPAKLTTGPIPTQEEANAWVEKHTLGLIKKFPVNITGLSSLVFAQALATDITWKKPLKVCSGSLLGGEFGKQIQNALSTENQDSQLSYGFIFDSKNAGKVVVHALKSSSGVTVYSVLASENVSFQDAHEAASELVAYKEFREIPKVDLFDVKLETSLWNIKESEIEVSKNSDVVRVSHAVSYLPAWEANGRHDIANTPGIPQAAEVLRGLLNPEFGPYSLEAAQSARGSFTREGFKAAAVTVMMLSYRGVSDGFDGMKTVPYREATFRFNRPYVVLATASASEEQPSSSLWNGIPIFSATVTEPSETESD